MSVEYEIILEELGRTFGIQNLGPDEHNTCLLKLQGGIEVYVEEDTKEHYLYFCSDLGELPQGRYRELIFEAALKNNTYKPIDNGIFAFSKKEDHLVLFEKIWMVNLNGQQLHDMLMSFAEQVKKWKESIAHNEVPVIGEGISSGARGIFGLKP